MGTLSIAVNNNHQFNEAVTKVWGKHAFKMGYEWLWQNEVSHNIGNPRLTLTFQDANGIGPTGVTTPNTGGITLADIELGYISGYAYNQQGASLLPVDSNQSLFFQDDWRITPKLTFNLGVRYENETPAHSKFPGQLSNGSTTVADNYYTSGSVAGLLTCPSGGCVGGWIQPKGFIWRRQNDNFQPRFGFAWNVEPNTVIRGGFALMTLDWNLGYTTQNEIWWLPISSTTRRSHNRPTASRPLQHPFGRSGIRSPPPEFARRNSDNGVHPLGPSYHHRVSAELSPPLHAELELHGAACAQERLHAAIVVRRPPQRRFWGDYQPGFPALRHRH